MRIVVALGGNALLRRGQPLTAQAQRENIKTAAHALAKIAINNELIITHGNGPQVGLLALQGNAYKPDELYPLDVLGAETEGMIGYMIEQEMGNLVPDERPLATLLTMVEVDSNDPAFGNPAKFIGPVYDEAEAQKMARDNHWSIKPDGKKWRRVVPSPLPKRIIEINPIRWLLEKNTIVIASGGGGIPTMYDADHNLQGVEAVIDKDLSSELLARELGADLYIMATDTPAVYLDWETPGQRGIKSVNPADLANHSFAAGSMGPKVSAARQFAEMTGKVAAIGALADLENIVAGTAGTLVSKQVVEMECY
ncbi:carbamate kinase [Neptunomonas antarctica]|uniref:Carbamate kinase n=1 Tax=Neptunomonas antarctica TaxID=619304 RepID=A0A1N7PI39_9GAMM|nr:carbamate kinase [Neptunomonas antarctica]SIT10323.1 carbamate kinase [Neptunomonas antarctica]